MWNVRVSVSETDERRSGSSCHKENWHKQCSDVTLGWVPAKIVMTLIMAMATKPNAQVHKLIRIYCKGHTASLCKGIL